MSFITEETGIASSRRSCPCRRPGYCRPCPCRRPGLRTPHQVPRKVGRIERKGLFCKASLTRLCRGKKKKILTLVRSRNNSTCVPGSARPRGMFFTMKKNLLIYVIIIGRFASPPTQVLDTWDIPATALRNQNRNRHDRTVSSPWLVPCHNIPHTRASSGLREAEAEAGKRAEAGEAEVLKASCLVLSPPPPENIPFHTVPPPAPLADVARRAFQKVRDHTHLP